ncbi:MAG: formylglycine-generating enzyme family protein [Polyangiaceae bacterium]|nr:formylglycine-generating enzyme family protein [Polyangiaceae bacterium]
MPPRPEPQSIAAWLFRLQSDGLITLSPRILSDAERLLRLRERWDPEELGCCLASLLAMNEERWRQVLEHFRQTFVILPAEDNKGGPAARLSTQGGAIDDEKRARDERSEGDRQSIAPPPIPRPAVSRGLRRLAYRLSGLGWAVLLLVAVLTGLFILPFVTKTVVNFAIPIVNGLDEEQPDAGAANGDGEETREAPADRGTAKDADSDGPDAGGGAKAASAALELVQPAKEHETVLSIPVEVKTPGPPIPWWFTWILAGVSALLATLGAHWWLTVRDYKRDVEEAARRAQDERVRLMGETSSLGIPYHVETEPPFSIGAIDDAATILGRMVRREEGLDFDVGGTIRRTIEEGGRIVPVFAPSGRREAILVLVDVEKGGHPYLGAVEQVLARWEKVGLSFVRYDYNQRPLKLVSRPAGLRMDLSELGSRAEGMPLLIFSRMARPRDIRGRMDWLRQLSPWPNRAWIDLDPRGAEEGRGEDALRVIRYAEGARPGEGARTAAGGGLPRYSFTAAGLLSCAEALASRGQKLRSPREAPLALSGAIEEALWQWAACACCVPDPSWPQLDSIRRAIGELREALPDARYVQRLIDWVQAEDLGAGAVGSGDCIRFKGEARAALIARLRAYDRIRWPKDSAARMEHRARMLLIKQLRAADVKGDPFEREKRDMKVAVHEAVLSPEKADRLLSEFADKAVAPELGELLREELDIQRRLMEGAPLAVATASAGEAWSVVVREGTWAWLEGRRGARLGDLVSFKKWAARSWRLGFGAVLLASGCWMGWWYENRERPLPPREIHKVRVVVTPATFKTVEAPRVVHVAMADVAPMEFIELPRGTFRMGSSEAERARFKGEAFGPSKEQSSDDEPLHPVEVYAFEIAAREVTQKQWHEVMGMRPFDCNYGCGDNGAAQNIRWVDAIFFMNRLTERENKALPKERQMTKCYNEEELTWDRRCTGYRLPTEAEWEYAARAGTTTAYSFGDDFTDLCRYANGADEMAARFHPDWTGNSCSDGFEHIAPVGLFRPNPWGLFDMHGNVWEWVWDWYGPYPERSPAGYAGPDNGSVHVLRGGSFVDVPRGLRSAERLKLNRKLKLVSVGLRAARGAYPPYFEGK